MKNKKTDKILKKNFVPLPDTKKGRQKIDDLQLNTSITLIFMRVANSLRIIPSLN